MGSATTNLELKPAVIAAADDASITDDGEPRPAPPSSNRYRWLQILSTFIVFTNTWGFLLTSGAFQTYYKLSLVKDRPSSTISWISTTCAFLVFVTGLVTGPLFDRGYYTALLLAGSLLQVFGLFMLSLCKEYYQLFLCHSICIGVGAGIVFTPSVSAAARCLPRPATRAKAMGLMACGSCVGGIVFPIMFRAVLSKHGFPSAVRSLAYLVLGLYLLSYPVILQSRRKDAAAPIIRRFFDLSALTDPPFMMLSVASVFSATGFYIPLLYLPLLTKARVPSIDPDLTIDLISILNGVSIVGRLAAGLAAAVFGPTETVTLSLVGGSLLLFCWIPVDTVAGTIVWTVFWGMVSGILVTLPGAIVPLLCPSLNVLGARTGMYWSWVGLGMLIGAPIGGAIYDPNSAGSKAWRLQVFAGVFMMAAAILNIYPLIHLRRRKRSTSVASD